MNRHAAIEQARLHETSINQQLETLSLHQPRLYLQALRQYIKSIDDSRALRAKPTPLELNESNGNFEISQGPPILKPDSVGQLIFKNDTQLSFALTLRDTGSESRLVAASYSLQLPEYQNSVSKFRPGFFRIHLEAKTPMDPLQKSRSHLHPGLQHIHIPFPIMEPRAVLNLLIFEVMQNYAQ